MKTNNNPWKRLMYLVIVPIVCLIFIISANIIAQESAQEISLHKSESLKLDLVSEAPIFKGCDKIPSEFEIRRCLSENITNYFYKYFNFEILKHLDNETKNKKIYIKFDINRNGEIQSTVAVYPTSAEINKEALHVINKIPKMTPGKIKGEPVSVKYRVVIDTSSEGKINVTSGSPVY